MLLALMLLAVAPDVYTKYKIEAPAVKVKKGEAALARIEIVPSGDAHVSPDAPISLKVKGGPALTLVRDTLGRPEAKETEAQGVRFDVPFTAAQSDTLTGSLTFFICT